MNAVSASSSARISGVIDRNQVYTLEEAKIRMRWSDAAVRSAKRKGLQLIKHGKRKYVTGEEILRFLLSLADSN